MKTNKERRVLNIGDIVYIFRGSNYGGSGQTWRDLWVPTKVTAVTSRSWVVGESRQEVKIPKAGPYGSRVCFTEAEIDDLAYARSNSYGIGAEVQYCRDAAVLRQIAALIGYTEKPQS